MGKPLMPWQRLVAEVGGEVLSDGRPAFREVVFTVPRQSGKTSLALPWEAQRAIGWEHLGPQVISYSAQDGSSARKKLLQDQLPLLERHQKALGIKRIYTGSGPFEGVVWENGSRLSLLASTEDAGHGQTIDLAVKDELFADHDDRRDQALIPAMATRRFGQVLACSTMGTDDSVPWNRLVERGRLACEAGKTDGIAYFEWSAPPDSDIADPALWSSFMPALGFTIDEDTVAHALEQMPENEFRRAWGNQQTKADDRVIPATLWNAVCDPNVEAQGQAVFAIDATPERSAAAIAVCSVGELPVVEVVEHRRGNPSWLVDRVVGLSEKNERAPVVVEARGPAGSFAADLERRGVRVVAVSSAEFVAASGRFFDGVVEAKMRVRREPVLDAAVAAAVRRAVGDSWAWGRRSAQEDVSPLVAATLAFWGAQNGPPEADFFVI